MSSIREALQEQRDKAQRLADFHLAQVGVYDEALTKVADLAAEYGFGDDGDSVATAPASTPAPRRQRRTTNRSSGGRRGTPGETLSVKDLKKAGNKSQAIKAVFASNPDAMPKDVIATCKDAGFDVTVGLVSSIKTKLKQAGSSSSGKSKSSTSSASQGTKSNLPLPAIVQACLHKAKNGLKLDELVVKCLDAGYVYTGKQRKNTPGWRKAVSQNVYQCCNDLMQTKNRRGWENDAPIVVRDETSHRYKLNPKAKKAA
jgi:hypothetical protein